MPFFFPLGAAFCCCDCWCLGCTFPPTPGATLPSLATTLAVRSACVAAPVTSSVHRALGLFGPHAAPAALCSSSVDLASPAGVARCSSRMSTQIDASHGQQNNAEYRMEERTGQGECLLPTGAYPSSLFCHSHNDAVHILQSSHPHPNIQPVFLVLRLKQSCGGDLLCTAECAAYKKRHVCTSSADISSTTGKTAAIAAIASVYKVSERATIFTIRTPATATQDNP